MIQFPQYKLLGIKVNRPLFGIWQVAALLGEGHIGKKAEIAFDFSRFHEYFRTGTGRQREPMLAALSFQHPEARLLMGSSYNTERTEADHGGPRRVTEFG